MAEALPESNLVKHANRELDLLGYPQLTRADLRSRNGSISSDEDYDREIRKSVMRIVAEFAKDHHSGNSAAQVIHMADRLLRYKPLSPLTNNPEEWFKIDAAMVNGEQLWQNVRSPGAFSHDEGKTFYLVDQYSPLANRLRKLEQWGLLPNFIRRWVWSHKSWIHTIHTSKEFNK